MEKKTYKFCVTGKIDLTDFDLEKSLLEQNQS